MKLPKCMKGHFYPLSYNEKCKYCVAQFGLTEASKQEKELKDYLNKKYNK